ncbi:MAG: rhodanese-like domain-containing protein [Candidatus Binatia bacterium]
MEIHQTTAEEAAATLARDPTAVYLDVRSEAEFAAGHPAGARNVPVLLVAPGRPPQPNPEFLATVERHLARDATVLVGCQSGMRSLRACELLLQAGWTAVVNVQGGFGGARDPAGRVLAAGWADSGLPVETGPDVGTR